MRWINWGSRGGNKLRPDSHRKDKINLQLNFKTKIRSHFMKGMAKPVENRKYKYSKTNYDKEFAGYNIE